jgi:hypothetical protein
VDSSLAGAQELVDVTSRRDFFAFGGNGIVRNAIPRSLFETRPQPSVLARALSVGADEFNTFALEGVGNRPHAFDIARHPSRGGRTLECG